MSRAEAKKIVRKYAQALADNNYNYSAVYLFGSTAKNKAHKWSDIDVAVITNKLKSDYDQNRLKLWKLRQGVDDRIEPHGFTPEDFKNIVDPMVYEIKTTGIKIA